MVNKVGSLSYHTAEKWSRFCPFCMTAMTAHWVNWCQFSQILNVLLCLINHQAFLELDVLKGMNLQLWDATGALHLHEKEKENKLSLAWPPESAALNSLVPLLNSVPLLEKLLISIYQTYHKVLQMYGSTKIKILEDMCLTVDLNFIL